MSQLGFQARFSRAERVDNDFSVPRLVPDCWKDHAERTFRLMIVIQNGDADADDALLELLARIGDACFGGYAEFFPERRMGGNRVRRHLGESQA